MDRKLSYMMWILSVTMALAMTGCGNQDMVNEEGVRQQNVDGTYGQTLDQQRHDGMMNGDRGNNQMNDGNRANDGQGMNHPRDEVEIAEEAAEKVAELDFVRSAYVLKTRENAYVAAMLENKDGLTKEMEQRIAQAVRNIDGSVERVYVSTNPSFIDRADAYINDVRAGRPVEGFFQEFSEMVERIFPNAR